MDVLIEVLGFGGKAFIVFVTVAVSTIFIFARARGGRSGEGEGYFEVRRLNDFIKGGADVLRGAMMTPKQRKKMYKELAKDAKTNEPLERSVFVLDFKGDLMATAVESLREEVTALIGVVGEQDEVVLRLESPGGAAHSYGLAAAQLARLRDRNLNLTVCIDRVAASGGYMMACVAQKIIAAPFAIVGSIGVVAPMPNVHQLMDRVGVQFENVTGGEFKRTVSPFIKNTVEAKQKFQDQIDELHQHFKDFVSAQRPTLDIETVATGEHFNGVRAAELGLVSEIMTSDDYLMSKLDEANIFQVSFHRHLSVREKLSGAATSFADSLSGAVSARVHRAPLH